MKGPDHLMGAKLDSKTYKWNMLVDIWAVLAAFGLKVCKKCKYNLNKFKKKFV